MTPVKYGGIGRAIDFEDLLGAVAGARLKIEGRQAEQILEITPGQGFAKRSQAVFRQIIGAYRLLGYGREAGACVVDLGRVCLNIH